MAQKPQIQIGIDLQQLKRQAERAAKILKDLLGAQPGGAGGGTNLPARLPAPMVVPKPKLPPELQRAPKQGLIETLLFGQRGEQGTMRGIKSSLAQIGDTISDTLGANKIGLGGVGSKVQGFGLVGGAGVALGGMAAAGVAGSVMYGRNYERSMFHMMPTMGRAGAASVLRQGRRALFDDDESAAMASPLAKGGALGGFGAVARAQRGLGIGSELSELLVGQAQKGKNVTSQSATRELSQAVRAGTISGLSQGRLGEVLRGVTAMQAGRGLGIGQNNSAIYSALGRIGGSLRGNEAFQALGGMERAYSNPATALGRNISLRAAGLGGSLGGDVFAAERRMEKGLFGQGGNPAAADQMLSSYRQAYGFGDKAHIGRAIVGDPSAEMRRGALIKEFAQNAGLTQTGAEKVIDAQEQGKSQAEVAKLMREGKPLQDQAYEAMINMGSFKGLEKAFQSAFDRLWHALEPLVKKLIPLMERLLEYLSSQGAKAITSGIEGGKILSTAEGRAKVMASVPGNVREYFAQAGDATERRKALLGVARDGVSMGRLDSAQDLTDDEKQARDMVRQLRAAEKMTGSKRDVAEAKAFSVSNDQLQSVATIVQAAIKAHQTIVHVHNAPGLQAAAHKVYQQGTHGTGVTPGSTR